MSYDDLQKHHSLGGLVDQFGRSLADNPDTKLEDYLGRVDQEFQAELYCELILYEFKTKELRQQQLEPYCLRFPQFREITKAVFEIGANSEDVVRAGRYLLIKTIAIGELGEVFEALDAKLGRRVAFKMISFERRNDSRLIARFEREIKAISKVASPYVITLFDCGQIESGEFRGRLFYTMELLHGVALDEEIKVRKFTPREAVDISRKIARGISDAHQAGIIHRDLKPGNILINEDNEVKIIDFGLAAGRLFANEFQTGDGELLGTPAFISPEMASGKLDDVGFHTDVYGIGAILYALLTGEAPHQYPTINATILAVQNSEPEKPSKLNEAVPVELDQICKACMAKDIKSRISSAAELENQLDRWATNLPLTIRSTPVLRKLKLWHQRNWVSIWIGALVLASIVLSLAATRFWQQKTNLASKAKSLEKSVIEIDANRNELAARTLLEHLITQTESSPPESEEKALMARMTANAASMLTADSNSIFQNLVNSLPNRGELDFNSLHGAEVSDVTVSNDGQFIATSSGQPSTCIVWEQFNGYTEKIRYSLPESHLDRLAISPDNKWILMNDSNQDKLFVGALHDPNADVIFIEKATSFRFSEDGKWLFVGYAPKVKKEDQKKNTLALVLLGGVSYKPDVRVFNAPNFTDELKVDRIRFINVTSPDGQWLASSDASISNIELFKRHDLSWEYVKSCRCRGSGRIRSWAFSPDSTRLFATRFTDPQLFCWELDDLDQKAIALRRPASENSSRDLTDSISHFEVSPDGKHLVAAYRSGMVVFWSLKDLSRPALVATKTERFDSFVRPAFILNATVFAPDAFMRTKNGKRTFDPSGYLIDDDVAEQIRFAGCKFGVNAMAAHFESGTLAASTSNADIHVWRMNEDFKFDKDKITKVYLPSQTIRSRGTNAKSIRLISKNVLLMSPEKRNWQANRPGAASVEDAAYFPSRGETKIAILDNPASVKIKTRFGQTDEKQRFGEHRHKKDGQYVLLENRRIIALIGEGQAQVSILKHSGQFGFLEIGSISRTDKLVQWIQPACPNRIFVGFGEKNRIEIIDEYLLVGGQIKRIGETTHNTPLAHTNRDGDYLLTLDELNGKSSFENQIIIRCLDLASSKQFSVELPKSIKDILSLHTSPDGRWIVAGCRKKGYEKGIIVWDKDNGFTAEAATMIDGANNLHVFTDSWLVLDTPRSPSFVRLMDSGPLRLDPIDGAYYRAESFAVHDNGLLAINGKIFRHQGNSKKTTSLFDLGKIREVHSTKFSPDGKELVRSVNFEGKHRILIYSVNPASNFAPVEEFDCVVDRKSRAVGNSLSTSQMAFIDGHLIVANQLSSSITVFKLSPEAIIRLVEIPTCDGSAPTELVGLGTRSIFYRTQDGGVDVLPITLDGWINRSKKFVWRELRSSELSDPISKAVLAAVKNANAVKLKNLAIEFSGQKTKLANQ